VADKQRVRWLPPPLVCALALAAAIAITGGTRAGAPPDGTAPDDRQADRIVGDVRGPVVRAAHGWGALVADTWVWAEVPLAAGERIAATGKLRTPRGLLDPGVPDRAALIASRGAHWELTAGTIERLADDPGWLDRVWRWAGEIQAEWAAQIGNDAGGAALRGIVTGDRAEVPPELDRRWRAIGIYHVLSVSGLHLAVVAGLLFALLRRLIAASPWGGRIRPARWAALPALVLAIAYTMITGAQLATVRALIVIAIALVAQALDRPLRLVDAVGCAAIVVLAWRPDDLWDPSFQLSFTAALVLAVLPRTAGSKLVRGITASAWVALATAPITAYHFHQIAAGGVIGNLVLTPIVELVALPVALAGLVLPWIGGALVAIAAWLVARVDDLAALLARAVPVATVGVASLVTVALLVALAVWLASRSRRNALDAVVWLALCVGWIFAKDPAPPGALRVTFLDVGQGDAAIVELPDGATWLVDAGGNAGAPELAHASATGNAIAATLAVHDRTQINIAILSHPHPDHYLGFAALAGVVPIGELWMADESALPAQPTDPRSWGAIAAMVGAPIVRPPLGLARAEAGVELVVLAPRYDDRQAADPVRTVNDNSLVVVLRYAGRSILFSGDVEAEGEEALVAAGLGHVDVVKVPHHGSPTSSTPGFVATTHPAFAVISCGVANRFGFPSPDVIARWRTVGADVERTDRAGAVTIEIAADGGLTVHRFVR
jgi:competence protein ComEC